MPGLSANRLKGLLLPFPPLAEQKRIVTKLGELIPLVEKYGKVQSSVDELNIQIKEQLKKSILQEAIQGKLVAPKTIDEPASVLLERIKEEKAKLFKAGKLKKKDLVDSVIFKGEDNKYYEQIGGETIDITEDIPFDLPSTWSWVRFGQYIKMTIGKTPPRGETIYWVNGKHPWVSISDMVEYGTILTTKEKVSVNAEKLFGDITPTGTLLMSFKLTVGRTAILSIEAYHNEAIISIYPFIDNEYSARNYLFYILPIIANLGDSKDAIKGKTLNSKSLYNLLTPLPPLKEQKRIVAKIEELFDKLK